MRPSHRSVLAALVLVAAGCGGGTNPVFITPTTLVAGSATAGATNGPIETASFNNPVNVAVAADGTVYVCDFDNSRIRRIRNGVVDTVVNQANFQRPFGIAIATDGTLYVQTDANDLGERNGTTGTVWRVDTVGGTATVVARNLGRPRGLAPLSDGRIAMANLTRNVISILNPSGGTETVIAGEDGVAGFTNGTGTAAHFSRPYGLTQISGGDLLVADQTNNCIRRVTLAGVVTTYAGTGTAGATNGALASATFNGPQDVKLSPNGRLYVADTTGHLIRRIYNGEVSTFAGDGVAGYVDGTGTSAEFFGLEGIGPSPDGKFLYVADGTGGEDVPYNRVRKFALP